MNYFLAFVVALTASLILTPIVRWTVLRLNFLEHPRESRWHRKPVALMGGIAIFISFMLVALLKVDLERNIFVLIIGGGIIFILGALDDLLGMHSRAKLAVIKFTVEIFIAFGVAYLGVSSKILTYRWMNISLTIFWIVGLTNAINLLDNMDGLSSGVTIIATLGILVLSLHKGQTTVVLLCLVLAGSCLGFLRYNFSPARIFMGDCGSLFLGYMLAVLAIMGGWQKSSPLAGAFLSPVLILGVPIFDTTLVTVLRFMHGKMPWQGGKDHSSHRLVHILGGSERGAVLILYGIGILAGALGLIVSKLNSLLAIFVAAALFLGMIIFGIKLSKVECYRAGNSSQIDADKRANGIERRT